MSLRRDVRYQVQCPVDYVLDGKPGQGTVFNLSRGGCAIETELFAAPDDPISLQITVSNQPTPIMIELGKVRWATKREFGVEFMVVENASKRRLDDFLLVVAKSKVSS
ncbi:MAG TPA: PilZ domain-containing protein [Nitrospira sp.]|nr:PilZ domain-containing protein [Nitrospira sp.]